MQSADTHAVGSHFLNALRASLATPEVTEARNDYNAFCEYCFSHSENGEPLKQAWHHREMARLRTEHDYLICWFPIEHGKTTQVIMTLCWLLGKHPDRQYAYVGANQDAAIKAVGAVQREIEGNAKLREVFPKLCPQLKAGSRQYEEWGKTSFRVAGCPRGTKDPSLIAYGIDGKILGSRLHGIILDNVLDASNTFTKKFREKITDIVRGEVMGRAYATGFILCMDTAWHTDDYMHTLSKEPAWHSVRFDAEDGHGFGETLWPAQWPLKRLQFKLSQMGQTAYDRQFRNRPLSESMAFFKQEYWDACYGRSQWLDSWPADRPAQVEMRTGVDLATRKGESHDLTVFSTVYADGAQRKLVNMQAARMEGVEILRRMVAIYRAFHAPVNRAGGNARFVVEDNAAQVYIIQMLKDAAICQALGLTPGETSDIRVRGRTTTKNRRDAELGIPGIASGIEMGRWDFPVHDEVRHLRDEMKAWSPEADHYGDRLMSLWHAGADIIDARETFRVDYI